MNWRKRVLFTAIVVFLPFVALALLEGFSSLVLFVGAARREGVAEAGHTERDTLLGWINLPNVNRPDLYGAGVGLHTNSQRFRHQGDLAPRAPGGKRRVVCSGDSFTLGYGVGDADAWCARLANSNVALETVNMGQGGYGLDQAYLWYIRDGLSLQPDVHLFALISADLLRMQGSRENGYPKPTLVIDGDSVRPVGVPVRGPGLGPIIVRWANAARDLRVSALLRHLVGNPAAWSDPSSKDSLTWVVAEAALHHLARRDSANLTSLVVVALPMIDDYKGAASDRWRHWASNAAARGEFKFLDLIEAFRRVPPDSVDRLFLPADYAVFHGAAGHYTVAGNAWVAEQLLKRVPELAAVKAIANTPH